MKRLLISLLFSFSLIFLTNSVYATHIMGGDLSYQHVSGNTYKVQLSVYVDNSGLSFTSPARVNYTSSCGSSYIGVTQDTVIPIGGCSSTFGYEKVVLSGNVTLFSGCTNVEFKFDAPCCQPSFTNIQSFGGLKLRSTSAGTNTPNSTASFLSDPYLVAEVGEESIYKIVTEELDGDSIDYKLVNSVLTNYTVGYNGLSPLGNTVNVQLDAKSGEMRFTPDQNGWYLVTVEVSDYQNGNKIGTSMMEWPIHVYSTGNALPEISGVGGSNFYQFNGCLGASTSFYALINDPDSASSTTVSLVGNDYGATVSQTNDTVYFSWLSGNVPSTGVFDFTIKVSDQNCGENYYTYTVEIDSCLNSPVWPGDANDNLVANVIDVLYVGLAYGSTGSIRQNATNQWVAQPSQDWNQSFVTGVNYKHADCDGNGIVDAADLLPIALNYGNTHPKRNNRTPYLASNQNLAFDLPDTVYSNQIISIPIKLGASSNPVAGAYGIAFSVEIDTNLIDENSLQLSLRNSLMGASSNLISMVKYLPKTAQVDIVISRTDGIDFSGFGSIGELQFSTTPSASISSMSFDIVSSTLVNSNNNHIPLNNLVDSTTLVNNGLTSLNEYEYSNQGFELYPNPVSDYLYIKLADNLSENLDVEMYNVAGEKVLVNRSNSQNGQISLDVKSLDAGMYFLRIRNGNNFETQKIIVK